MTWEARFDRITDRIGRVCLYAAFGLLLICAFVQFEKWIGKELSRIETQAEVRR